MRPHVPPWLRLLAALCAAAATAGCGAWLGSPQGSAPSPSRVASASGAASSAAGPQGQTLPVAATPPSATAEGQIGLPVAAVTGLDIHAAAFLPDGTGLLGAWSGPGCYSGTGSCAWRLLRAAADGDSWAMTQPTPGFLTGLSFPDASRGWALGGTCNPEAPAAGCVSSVLASEDGGVSWKTVYTRPDALFLKVDFVDARTGWLGLKDGTLLRSGDGGRTWAAATPPCAAIPGMTELASFSFLDATDGLAVCQAAAPAATVGKEILRTADAGRTWTPLHASVPSSGGVLDLTVASADSAWLCTWPVGGPLFFSHDGGRTWSPAGAALGGANVVALSAPVGAPAAVYAVIGLGPSAAVVGSSDGGLSWSPVYPRIGPFLGEGGGPAVQFTGPSTGYGIGVPANPGAVFATPDAGRTWSAVGRLPAGDALIDWSFGAPGVAWAIVVPQGGTPQLLSTADAGRTWTAVVNAPAAPRLAIRTAAGGVMIAGNTLFRSTDGGNRFVPVGPAAGIVALALPAGGDGWAIVDGALRRSSDAGRTWEPVTALPAGEDAVALSFADAAHGWVLTDSACDGAGPCDQTLWSTADGGRTWSSLALGPVGVVTIDFPSPADGWLVTDAGVLYRSTDGGRSWLPLQ